MRRKFREYIQDQPYLFPPNLEDFIPEHHPVRIVNQIIDDLDLSDLYQSYSGLGPSSYHPKLLLKGIVYGYLNNIYSSRRIEEAIASNVYFMWLCGMQTPDHNTIARFRSGRLADYVQPIFTKIVVFLAQEGVLSLKTTYIDGTKFEADANKYSFVWQKSVLRNKEKLISHLEELWKFAKGIAQEELKDLEDVDFSTISSDKLYDMIADIQSALKKNNRPKGTTKNQSP